METGWSLHYILDKVNVVMLALRPLMPRTTRRMYPAAPPTSSANWRSGNGSMKGKNLPRSPNPVRVWIR